MKTLLFALLTISAAQADCGGFNCLNYGIKNMSYEEHQRAKFIDDQAEALDEAIDKIEESDIKPFRQPVA